jgi:hypothetical protein
MSIKYTNNFQCKALQNFTQIAIFGMKIYHLATLISRDFVDILTARGSTPELCASDVSRCSKKKLYLLRLGDGLADEAVGQEVLVGRVCGHVHGRRVFVLVEEEMT